jgi:ribose transport system substrate-binding protein
MKFSQLKLFAVALAFSLVLPGCGNKDETKNTPGAPVAAKGKKLKLAFVCNNAANFWTIARTGCNEAAKELGDVEVDFRIPGSGSAAEQQQILNDLLARGEDGIAMSPKDPANQTDFLNKIASQTLFITTDSDAPASKRVCYIGTDNEAAGEQAGQLIKEALPNGGKIMLFVGSMDAQNAQDRAGGIKQALKNSNVQVIDVRTDDTDPVRAQKNAEDTLVKYPDIAALVGLWNYNGPAILNAVRNSNLKGRIKIVCFDEEADTLAGIAAGDVYGTVVQQPFEFGKQAITRMDHYLHGDTNALAGGKIFVPTQAIKQDNVAEFQARLKSILGK